MCESARVSVCLWVPEGSPAVTPHADENAGVAECGTANTPTDSFTQCHLLMTLYIHGLITDQDVSGSRSHTHSRSRLQSFHIK